MWRILDKYEIGITKLQPFDDLNKLYLISKIDPSQESNFESLLKYFPNTTGFFFFEDKYENLKNEWELFLKILICYYRFIHRI